MAITWRVRKCDLCFHKIDDENGCSIQKFVLNDYQDPALDSFGTQGEWVTGKRRAIRPCMDYVQVYREVHTWGIPFVKMGKWPWPVGGAENDLVD